MDTKERLSQLRLAVKNHPTRTQLLAYAFLRGIPYRRVELRCHEFHKPRYMDLWDMVHGTKTDWWRMNFNDICLKTKDIGEWLGVPPQPEWEAAYGRKREAYLEAKRARAEAIRAERACA